MTEPHPGEPPATQSEDPANPAAAASPVRSGMFLLELVPVPVSTSIGPRPTTPSGSAFTWTSTCGRPTGSGSCNSARRVPRARSP